MKSPAIIIGLFLAGCCGSEKNSDSEVNRWLDLEIERPESEEMPEVVFENDYEEPDENGLITNTYLVNPAVVEIPLVPEQNEGRAAPDPFAAPTASETDFALRIPRKIDPRRALEFFGVEFGPGSNATYDRKTLALRVTQTPDQMNLVEAVIEGRTGYHFESEILLRVEIFELRAADALKLEQSAGEYFDHSAERKAVLDRVRNGAARIVTTANLPCRSGQRASYEDSREIRFAGGFKWEGEGENRTLMPEMLGMQAGTIVEVDPVLGPDDVTIDLRIGIDHQLGPPVRRVSKLSVPGMDAPAVIESPQVPIGSIRVDEVTRSGRIRLLCSWEVPSDVQDESKRRIVFFKASARRRSH